MQTILKRFEIWLLFSIIAASLWWSFQAKVIDPPSLSLHPSVTPTLQVETVPIDSTLLEVRKVNLTTLDHGTIVELTLLGRSGTDQPVALGSDNVELLTTDGEGVHRFFAPFDPDPMLASDEKSLVTLKYWLHTPVEVLWLTYRDQTVKVEIPNTSI